MFNRTFRPSNLPNLPLENCQFKDKCIIYLSSSMAFESLIVLAIGNLEGIFKCENNKKTKLKQKN